MKNDKRKRSRDTRLTWKTPSNAEGEKTSASQQILYYIGGGSELSYNLINPS
jgi:hypothetical protein